MNKEQVLKTLIIGIFAVLIMFIFEVVFSFDSICNSISSWISNIDGWIVYLVIFFIMLIQVSLIPVPIWVVINAAVIIPSINLSLDSLSAWIFIGVSTFACIIGVIFNYIIGYKFGVKAVKWCAGNEEDFNKWSRYLNEKGKVWYALTVLLPIFPDDLLCYVAGSVKFNFVYFLIVNIICRIIGLTCVILSLTILQKANSGGLPITAIGWGIVLAVMIILYFVLKHKINKEKELKEIKENNER